MPGRITLEVLSGALKGKERSLRLHPDVCFEDHKIIIRQHDVYLFGRAKDCHVRLPEDDPLVSRHHFLVECAPPRVILRDLTSRHGTYVNGVRHGGWVPGELDATQAPVVHEGVFLRGGDQITIGRTTIRVGVERTRQCANCGAEDEGEFEAPVAEAAEHWFCSSCLTVGKKLERPAWQALGRICCECGSPIGNEVHRTPDGFALCEECGRHQPAAPERIAAELLHRIEDRGPGRPKIPNYEILDLLGRGASGHVYRAHRVTDQGQVAVKILSAGALASPKARQEFLREMESTRAFVHPHIVRLLDHGACRDVFYLVTEYCEGGNVASLLALAGGSIPVAEATRVALETLDALAFIHRSNHVHRDVKPANILLRREGGRLVAKLADLGLAKNFQLAGFSGMTLAGQFAGTYEFMPREQLTGYRFLKPSSDVWSLAATFYHLLTGAYPLEFSPGRDKAAVVLESKVIPIRQRDPDVPPAIADVIQQALSPEPEQRFQDALEMRMRLLDALDRPPR